MIDRRIVVELVPGIAFLAGNAAGGIFVGAGLALVATALALVLRWRWDRALPWLAIAILVLTLVLVTAGLVLDDTTFVKISGTLGALAFAAILTLGLRLRPSLLRRTLGYRLHLSDRGWRILHAAWIGLALLRAAANEAVWRTMPDEAWAIYNGLSDFAWFGLVFLATSLVAHAHWSDEAAPP